jgi:hypothetical protein
MTIDPADQSFPWVSNQNGVLHYLTTGNALFDGAAGAPCVFTDAIVLGFINAADPRVAQWLALVDNDINYKAMEYGLLTSQILLPLHPRLQEYAVAYFSYMIFRDNIGVNNVNTAADEKYRVKFDEFKIELERTRKLLTRDIFWLQDLAIRGINRSGGACDMVRG